MKNKLLSLFIILNLIFLLNIDVSAYTVSEKVRIGIKYGSSALTSVTVSSDNGFNIKASGKEEKMIAKISSKKLKIDSNYNNGLNSYLVVEQSGFGTFHDAKTYCEMNNGATVPLYKGGILYAVREGLYTYNDALFAQNQAKLINASAYMIEPSSNLVKVFDGDKCILTFSQDEEYVLALSDLNDGLLKFGSEETYRDTMEFKKTGNALYIINNITMQHYLYSVVTAEIGATAPLEAQKAQAICARTYTEQNLNRHKSDGFNLCASVHCQAYIGTKWERPQALSAVDATDKMILTYNGKPISAVYFAHSGGRTANVEDVWGSPYPYLKSVEDKYCNDYTWEYKLDYAEITKKMNEKGYNLGTVTDIKITETTDFGLVKKLTITGTNGSKTFERESARTILGLKSQKFSIPSTGLSHLVKNDTATTVKNIKTVLTANGIISVGDTVKVKDGNGTVKTLTAPAGTVIYGSGNGHHVGMSQHGAMEYAKNDGWTYDQILKHYYQGVTIEGL